MTTTRDGRAPDARTGFAPVLRCAIERRGLSLERLQSRLGDLGAQVSVATLSYWQSGRSEPGRRSSLVAVPALEKILELEPGTLGAQLGHRAQRSVEPGTDLRDVLDEGQPTPDELRHEDARLRDQLEILSEHCSVDVGPDGAVRSRWVRRVLVASVAGADRFLVLRVDPARADGDREPAIEPLLHCSLGRTYTSHDRSLVGQEVLLDRRLEQGDSAIVEYRLTGLGGGRSYATLRRMPLRELVLEVRFDPAARPATVEMVHSDLDGAGEVVGPVQPDSTGCVRMIRHHLAPGRYAVRWG
ncbi:helix-turn-helix domain-containing protein [Solicola sp. PLA-1-18]|uniref:helix-turn-helix domain-containing protein n=1 Tax=Solicola sp. PLA-1-18 TaxID=3380532 RepID=UPI003B7D4DEA